MAGERHVFMCRSVFPFTLHTFRIAGRKEQLCLRQTCCCSQMLPSYVVRQPPVVKGFTNLLNANPMCH